MVKNGINRVDGKGAENGQGGELFSDRAEDGGFINGRGAQNRDPARHDGTPHRLGLAQQIQRLRHRRIDRPAAFRPPPNITPVDTLV